MSFDESGSDDSSHYTKEYFITRTFDERKPQVPYVQGTRFTVQQHNPRPPVKIDPITRCTLTDKKEREKMEQLHPHEQWLQYHPLPGPYGPLTLELEIPLAIRLWLRFSKRIPQ